MPTEDFQQLLDMGRPPNIKKLFPNSRALIVSGKYIDRAMIRKGAAMTIAANGRSNIVIRGTLKAAQENGAAVIIEIARSEGGTGAYCAVNYWNIARQVDAMMNEMEITIPVAIHADHYGIKKEEDLAIARVEIPTLFEAGITSIAIDASHMPDDKNLQANIDLCRFVPKWAGLETEIGEIKGKEGLSSPDEALFLIRGLNAHGIFPDWIALNNGTTHGIEQNDAGIQLELTKQIHEALSPYQISGAQHGTSGNNTGRLREIAVNTRTTKANVATALQMLSWGVSVNEFGNAQVDESNNFIKIKDKGVSDKLWEEMLYYASTRDIQGGNFKKLNLPFENKILSQPLEVRERMTLRVFKFVHHLLNDVFGAAGTAALVMDLIRETGSHDPGPKMERIESPDQWTEEDIIRKASLLNTDRGPEGDYDD